MVLLIVWIVVAVLAVLVLGGLLYSVLGAAKRLQREVEGARRDAAPVLTDLQAALTAVEERQRRKGGH